MNRNILAMSFVALFTVSMMPLAFADSVEPFFVWLNMNGATYDTEADLIHFNLFSGDDLKYYYLEAYVDNRFVFSDTIYGLEPTTEGEITGTYTIDVPEPFNELDSFQLKTLTHSNQVGGAWFYQP